MEIIYSG